MLVFLPAEVNPPVEGSIIAPSQRLCRVHYRPMNSPSGEKRTGQWSPFLHTTTSPPRFTPSQYEVTKDLLIRRSRTGKSSVPEPALQMLAGGIAGCATWLPPVYCLDVIKTRIQSAEPGVYRGSWDCLRKTVRCVGESQKTC